MVLAAAVVVYNMSCGESPTCQALEKLRDPDLMVVIHDNSTKDFGNQEYCAEKGWVYLGGAGNVGISKAYNVCVDYLLDGDKADMLCLFDDDTDLDPSYFAMLRQARTAGEGKIFVPLIHSGGVLLSPCVLKSGHRVSLFTDEQAALAYEGSELTAINSCMAIDLSVFANYRYDENIFLDGVDHNFVMDMRARGEMLTVFPYRCDHGFSGNEKTAKESALNRFRIYAKDYRYILKNDRLAYFKLVGKRAVRLALQYRSMAFLTAFSQKS